ncbi:GH11750 [Drosophila grimshawi]|uniref:GH11750 n=1 Tax=Drosophila grimshawi TaxID=7222 RepID=B4K0M9_DROGR|nr:GH11750 [Drosophila grimshawi]
MELVADRLKVDEKKRLASEPLITENDKEDADAGIGAGYGEVAPTSKPDIAKDGFAVDYLLQKISMLQLRLVEAQKTLQAERDEKHVLHKSIEKNTELGHAMRRAEQYEAEVRNERNKDRELNIKLDVAMKEANSLKRCRSNSRDANCSPDISSDGLKNVNSEDGLVTKLPSEVKDHQLTGEAEATTADTEQAMQPMEVDTDAPLLTINSASTASVAAAPNSEVNPTKVDKCPVLNGAGIVGLAATATGTVVGAITKPAPTNTTGVKGDANMLSQAKKSSARNSINEDGSTMCHDPVMPSWWNPPSRSQRNHHPMSSAGASSHPALHTFADCGTRQ